MRSALTNATLLKLYHLDYSAITVYIPTETYILAQFKMARQGRKREMSELFAELLQEMARSSKMNIQQSGLQGIRRFKSWIWRPSEV